MRLLVLALGLATLAMAGCSQGTFEKEVTLASGGAVEVNLSLGNGETVRWIGSATGPLSFNTHTHHGSDVQEFERQTSTKFKGTLQAPSAGLYSLFWKNESQESVTLHFSIDGGVVDSFHAP